jgi:uncharacterized protein YndB with AHSA1/START domain
MPATTTNTTTKMLSDRSFAVTRTFRVPAARLFAAYTDPKQLAQWWAPWGGTFKVEAMDVRPGGKYRYVQSVPGRPTMAFVGSYLEVKPVTRLVYTFQVEGQPNVVTATVELAEANGTTKLTLTNDYGTKEAYDAAAKYGAVNGTKAALDALAKFLGETGQGA